MRSEKDNILEFNQNIKSDKMPYIIYADIESLIRKTDGCAMRKIFNNRCQQLGDLITQKKKTYFVL